MSSLAYTFIIVVMAGLLASVLYGLLWAIRHGQFSNFAKGATCIFDADEPLGYRTDSFPGEKPLNP